MKALYKALLLCALIFTFFTFFQQPKNTKNKYVTDVRIIGYRDGQHTQTYRYTQPSKISSVLTYLRLLDPHGKQVPAEEGGHSYQILLTYSDGSAKEYLLHEYSSFSQNGGIWKRVKPAYSQLLYPLLHLLPADG